MGVQHDLAESLVGGEAVVGWRRPGVGDEHPKARWSLLRPQPGAARVRYRRDEAEERAADVIADGL
jgi:hypothetical protein